MGLAYHYNKRLPAVHLNLECLIRIRVDACVSNPVVADVARIEAPQISRSHDGMVSVAHRFRIDRHALSCTSGVGERVFIVTEGIRITKDRARCTRRTGLRIAALGEFISLRGVASADASVNHDWSA